MWDWCGEPGGASRCVVLVGRQPGVAWRRVVVPREMLKTASWLASLSNACARMNISSCSTNGEEMEVRGAVSLGLDHIT